MARHVMKMPDVGEGVVEVEVIEWHVKPGDRVAEDQHFVDVMTDKATVEMSSPVAGVVTELCAEPGTRITVGAQLIVFETDAAQAQGGHAEPASDVTRSAEPQPQPSVPAPEPAPVPEPESEPQPPAADREIEPNAGAMVADAIDTGVIPASPPLTHAAGHRPVAAPTVRRRAREALIDLAHVPATGKGGRITHEDLDRYISGGRRAVAPAPPATRAAEPAATGGAQARSVAVPAGTPAAQPARQAFAAGGTREVRVIGLRRVIADKMTQSKRRIPHYAYVEDIDMTELEALRQHLNGARRAGQPKLTYLPFIIRALVKALRDFPQCNAHFDDEAGILTEYEAVHVGIATQTPNGLMVPVLHDAQALDLWQTAAGMQRLSEAARAGKASRAELSGSTITITSLGKLGGLASTPVINHPEVAILGINRSELRPVVRDGEIVARLMMNLSASFDHRIVDGYDGASLVQAIKALLEYPATIFV